MCLTKRLSIPIKFLMFLTAIVGLISCKARETLILQNPHNYQRNDELITLHRAFFEDKFGVIPDKRFLSAGKNAFQYVDTNKDGKWDEANLILSFAAKQELKVPVVIGNKSAKQSDVQAHIRHRRKNADDTFGPLITIDSNDDLRPFEFFYVCVRQTCIFRTILYHRSAANLTTYSGAKFTTIPDQTLPVIPLESLPDISFKDFWTKKSGGKLADIPA